MAALKGAVGHNNAAVTVVIFATGVYLLNCLVSNRIGVVFALDRILGKMLVGDDVNSLIAAFLSDFYMVKTLSSQHLCASVLIFMSVHLVKFLCFVYVFRDFVQKYLKSFHSFFKCISHFCHICFVYY